jgi:hypothetical protein
MENSLILGIPEIQWIGLKKESIFHQDNKRNGGSGMNP